MKVNISKEKIQSVLKEYDWVNDEKQCLERVEQNGWALEHVQNKTDEICLAAVEQNGGALRDVPEALRTEAICLAAVKQHEESIQYVPHEILKKWLNQDDIKERLNELEN